jgi:asparagine synthase (glutamine-hydrolysing)
MSAQRAFSKAVELRSPFSDRRMIEFAIQMPIEGKLSIPWYKYVLRLALAGILPESVRWRRDLWQHPGWRFNETLIREAKQQFQDGLTFGNLTTAQHRWIDTSRVDEALHHFNRNQEFTLGYNLLVLSVLVKWLKARPQLFEALA